MAILPPFQSTAAAPAGQVRELRSPRELRAVEAEWDDLLTRSTTTLPTLRAACVADWLERFAARREIRLLAVERHGRFTAALPLVGVGRLGGWVVGRLPSNYWAPCGELLLEETEEATPSLALLAARLRRLRWPLLSLGWIPLEEPRWQWLGMALRRAGMEVEYTRDFAVGWLPLRGPWEAYRQARSKSHRRSLERGRSKLASRGPVRGELLDRLEPAEVEGVLRRGFELEHRSWKGRAGTSVLAAERFSLYLEQARQLARHGELLLAFLLVGEEQAAFEYGWFRGGVYHSYKVGYDPAFANGSPGQVLFEEIVRHGFERGWRGIHCMGAVSPDITRWGVEEVPFGRMQIAISWPGRALRWAERGVRAWRGRGE